MLVLRLPGGCAITCTPASRISSPVIPASSRRRRRRRREKLRKVPVHGVERLAQQLAARGRSCGSRLRASSPPLRGRWPARRGSSCAPGSHGLLERGQVDRAQLVDRLRDPRDLALQRRGARRALGLGGETSSFAPASVSCVANWSKLSLAACSFRRSSPSFSRSGAALASACSFASSSSRSASGSGLNGVARLGELLLAGDPQLHRLLQGLAHRQDRVGGELLVQPHDLGVGTLDLLVDHADRVVHLGDLGGALALAEARPARRARPAARRLAAR